MQHIFKSTGFAVRLISVVFLFSAISGCTQNDGRIGPIFGTWALDDITDASGAPVATPDSCRLTWLFQSSTVCMRELLPYHSTLSYWGNWDMSDRILTLDYDNHDDIDPPGTFLYCLPEGYGFPKAPAVMRFSVTHLDNSRLDVNYTTEQGATLRYRFHKIP